MKNYIVYENEELRLREINPQDLNLIRNWHNDSSLGKGFMTDKSIDIDIQKKWYSDYKKNPNNVFFIVEEKIALNMSIGVVSIHIIDDKTVEFDRFVIGEKTAKGKGYGIKIMHLAQEYIFKEMKVKYSTLEVYCHNRPAVKTYIKVGYRIRDIIEKDGREMYSMRAVRHAK